MNERLEFSSGEGGVNVWLWVSLLVGKDGGFRLFLVILEWNCERLLPTHQAGLSMPVRFSSEQVPASFDERHQASDQRWDCI